MGVLVTVAELWRYPVKSMRGEQLTQARLDSLGVYGDRIVHLENSAGRTITSRTHRALLGHAATLDDEKNPRIDGLDWRDPRIAQRMEEIGGEDSKLVFDESVDRFDILPLLVATDGAIEAFGYDRRRLRPNIIVGEVDGLAERSWPGNALRIGSAVIGVQDLRGRCIMTTFDPDTLQDDPQVLRSVMRKFAGKLALNCYVIPGGEIHVGDDVELLRLGHRDDGKENVVTNPVMRPPLPPFTFESATEKVRLAEDGWNTRDPDRVSLAYTEDSVWRNRSAFLQGRAEIVRFLHGKWAKELEYRLIKELWAFTSTCIAVRFAYEWHDAEGQWFRSYGNKNWEFEADGLMRRRIVSINDLSISESERKYRWPLGRRPDDHPGLSDLDL